MIKNKLIGLSQARNACLYEFSTDILNVRVPLIDPYTHKPTDEYIYRYQNPMFSAYLEKRHITRSEIWPKIHVLQGVPKQEEHHLNNQSLYSLKKVLDEDVMKKIAEEDPSLINSAYIISMFSEDYFKEMIDEYCNKVLVSGKAPSTQAQLEVEEKVREYHRMFYFGQRISSLQRQIESFYLATKQQKSLKRKITPRNAYLRCNWRTQDQRLLEDYVNWPETDLNLSDLNFRPYYEPLNITQRLPHAQKFNRLLAGDSFLQRMAFNYNFKDQYRVSPMYINWIVEKIFSRVVQYSKCLEFTHQLKIPHDFAIELCILNMNMWLILSRLKQFDNKVTKNIVEKLTIHFKRYINQAVSSINVKRQMAAQKSFGQILDLSSQALNYHFKFYESTKNNNYENIDALVWSCALMEKVERYGDEVYILSEYLVKNWENIQKMEEKDFLDGVCELDPFLYDPDFIEKIKTINPPLGSEEFESQFNSNKNDKSYYYRVKKQDGETPFVINSDTPSQNYKYSLFRSILDKMVHAYKKYFVNIDEYDHFSEMDEQKRKKQKLEKKSPWKGDSEHISEVNEEFDKIDKIRRSRRNSSNIKIDENSH